MTERPVFAPPPDGVRDVLRRARARRRRQALLATSGVAVAGTVAGVLLAAPGVGAGADRLSVIPASPAPSGSPAPTPASSRPGLPTPAATVARGGAGHGAPVAAPPPFAGPAPTDSPQPTAPTHRRSAAAPITRSTVAMSPACDAATAAEGGGWCLLYSGPQTARRKHPVTLSAQLCRPSVYGDGTVQFSDSRQIDFQLYDQSGTTVWRAGQGVSYSAKPATVVVRQGTCLRWAASWDTIAPNGFYAPPGGYSVSIGLDTSGATTTTSGDVLTLTD